MFYKTTNLTNIPLDVKVNQNNFNKYDSKPPKNLGASYMEIPFKED